MAENQETIDRGIYEAQVKEQIAEEVKGKISDLIQGGVGRQVVTTRAAILYLKKNVGSDIAAVLTSVPAGDLSGFARPQTKKRPTPLQARNIAAAYVVVDILLSHLSKEGVGEWLVDYSDYLAGIPALEMSRRPEDVRMAALSLIAGRG